MRKHLRPGTLVIVLFAAMTFAGSFFAKPAFAGEGAGTTEICPAETGFTAENGKDTEVPIAEEAYAETCGQAAGDNPEDPRLPIRTVSLGFVPPAPGTEVTQTADGEVYVTDPALELTAPENANYKIADSGSWYVSDPVSKTPLTGTFTMDENETYYAVVIVESVGDNRFTNEVSFDTDVENAGNIRRSVLSDDTLRLCFAFTPREETAQDDFFSVWLCDTNQAHNLGGSVKIDVTLPDGSVWAKSGKTVSITTDQTVPAGSKVRLTAIPDEEYVFEGWYPANVNKTSLSDPHYMENQLLSTDPVYEFTGNPIGEKQNPRICAVFTPEVIEVESIKLDRTSVTLKPGEIDKLTATVLPSNAVDATVSWKSGNTAVVKVGSTGKIKGIAPGTAKVRAMTPNGTKMFCTVTVKNSEVTKVTLNKTSASTNVGLTLQLTATVTPSDAENTAITWKSSNTKVAKVSAAGLVTAVRAGSCSITATAANGVQAACNVKVAEKYAYELSKDGVYRFLSNTTTIKKLKNAGWSYKKAFRVAGKSTIPVYEIYDKTTKRYRYTANKTDAVAAKKAGSTVSTAFYACKTQTTPVYEICGKDGKRYYYTTKKSTVTAQKKKGWTYKGIAWYAELAAI